MKIDWIEYDRTDDIIEIMIKDCSGRILDRFRFNGKDKRAFGKVMKILKETYGFTPKNFPEIEIEN